MLDDWPIAELMDQVDVDYLSADDALGAGWNFEEDLLYATQDQLVPRSYAQVMRLPPGEREPWLKACRVQCQSFLAIPAISGVLQPSQWTKAPPIRLSWVLSTKPATGEPKARIVMLGTHEGGSTF